MAEAIGKRWARWQVRPRREIESLYRRTREIILVAAVTGAVVGLAVAGFEWLTVRVLLEHVEELRTWMIVAMPLVGLTVSALVLRTVGGGASGSTSDEYLKAFHSPTHKLTERPAVARLLAAVATLGSGVPLGFEGPSMYTGATIGATLQRRFRKLFRGSDPRLLLVCGAAAGVAAIFKAPATGAVFAIEVPYHGDVAHRFLLPASVSAAAGYLTFVLVWGTERLIPVQGLPAFSAVDIGGALVVGIVGGIFARLFALVLRTAKDWSVSTSTWMRVLYGGGSLALLVAVGYLLTDEPVMIGPGFGAVEWALDPSHGAAVILVVLLLRCLATMSAVAGGGVGGLFVPLVVAGALLGRAVGALFGQLDDSLFVVIGVAAVLSAGYRVPLAAIIFVAETTGRPGFVVPGLIASVAAELMMGRSSVTNHQVRRDTLLRPGEAAS